MAEALRWYAGGVVFYAGVKADDRRVKAAFTWIQRFYTVDENPGLGNQGLYYYYHTFAKTLELVDMTRNATQALVQVSSSRGRLPDQFPQLRDFGGLGLDTFASSRSHVFDLSDQRH